MTWVMHGPAALMMGTVIHLNSKHWQSSSLHTEHKWHFKLLGHVGPDFYVKCACQVSFYTKLRCNFNHSKKRFQLRMMQTQWLAHAPSLASFLFLSRCCYLLGRETWMHCVQFIGITLHDFQLCSLKHCQAQTHEKVVNSVVTLQWNRWSRGTTGSMHGSNRSRWELQEHNTAGNLHFMKTEYS